MIMETITFMVGYDADFRDAVKAGWGCGYLMIPEKHPILKNWGEPDAEGYVDHYLQPKGFSEEITFTERETLNGEPYVTIGFDTAHSYNKPEIHNFKWVFEKTFELKRLVDSFE